MNVCDRTASLVEAWGSVSSHLANSYGLYCLVEYDQLILVESNNVVLGPIITLVIIEAHFD